MMLSVFVWMSVALCDTPKTPKEVRSDVSTKTARLDEARDSVEDLRTELGLVHDKLREAQKDGAATEAELSEIKAQVAKLTKELEDVRKERDKLAKEQRELEDERQKLRNLGVGQLDKIVKLSASGGKGRGVARDTVDVSVGRGTVRDTDSGCEIRLGVRDSAKGSLQSQGITSISVVYDSRIVNLDETLASLKNTEVLLDREQLCSVLRSDLQNGDAFKVEVGFLDVDDRETIGAYRMDFERNPLEFRLGLSTMLGGDLSADLSSFNVVEALEIGARWNVPAGYQNKDFFLAASVFGGPAITADTRASASEGDSAEVITFLAGGTVSFGKFMGVGIGYDILNEAPFLVIVPGQLTASIL